MKVYMGPYPKSKITTWKLYRGYLKLSHPRKKWYDVDETDYNICDKIIVRILSFIDDVILRPVNFVLKRTTDRKIKVRIDPYDTWSADYTLAHIIHPLLVALEKHGTPWTDREDAPADEKYDNHKDKNNDWERGYNEDRWEYIMGEMIFAFDKIKEGDWDIQIYKRCGDWTDEAIEERRQIQERINNGLRLFGKYYQNLWD